jgi:formylmethanofuran dehydrogenase subunit E
MIYRFKEAMVSDEKQTSAKDEDTVLCPWCEDAVIENIVIIKGKPHCTLCADDYAEHLKEMYNSYYHAVW